MLLSWSLLGTRAARACVVELRHRPCPTGTASHYPQAKTSAMCPTGDGAWSCASSQGARPHNEDGFTARAPLYAVYDGHGWRGAVDRLRAFMASCAAPADARGLADMYAAAAHDLRGETSGVMSACVLLGEGGAAHLAWVGDCTAAVFSPETGRVVRAADLTRLDGGEVSDEPGERFASDPHALSGGVRSWVQSRQEPGGLGHVGVPRRFEDPRSQREYDKLFRLSGRELIVHVHVWLPFAPQGMSTHIAGSIEPTRALGDAQQAGTVARGAEVLSVAHCPAGSFAALASDGALDGAAFQDMESLCMFLSDPLSFVRQRFYGPWQNLTTLLVAGGQLPCVQPRPDELSRHLLYAAWQRIKDWDDVRALLQAHLDAVGKLRPQGKGAWYQACAASVRWMCEQTEGCDGGLLRSPSRAVCAAVHMAVIMGSQDNVTVMAVRL